MDKKKILIAVVVLLVAAGGVYKTKFAKAEPKPKVHGTVYVMPKEFTVNLDAGRFAKLGVGLVLDHSYHPEAGHGATPPEGYGADPQEALLRDIVTDKLTGVKSDELIEEKGRHHLKEEIAKKINKTTDVKVEHVVFTDVAVQ